MNIKYCGNTNIDIKEQRNARKAVITYTGKEYALAWEVYEILIEKGYKFIDSYDCDDDRCEMWFGVSDKQDYEELKEFYKKFKSNCKQIIKGDDFKMKINYQGNKNNPADRFAIITVGLKENDFIDILATEMRDNNYTICGTLEKCDSTDLFIQVDDKNDYEYVKNIYKMIKNRYVKNIKVQNEQKGPEELKENNEIPFMNVKYSEKELKENDKKILKKLNFLERINIVYSVGFGLKIFGDLQGTFNEINKTFKVSKKDIGFLVNIMNPLTMFTVDENKYKMVIADELYKLPNIIIDWISLNTISAFNDDMILIDNCGVFDLSKGCFNGSVPEFKKILNEIEVKIIQEIEIEENEYYLVYDKKSVERAIKKLKTCEESDDKMITIVYDGKKYDAEIIGEYYDSDFTELIHTHTDTPQEFFDEYIKLDPDFINLFDYDFVPID